MTKIKINRLTICTGWFTVATMVAAMLAIPAPTSCMDYELPGDCGEIVCLRQFGTPFSHAWSYADKYSLCMHTNSTSQEKYFVFGKADDELGMLCTEYALTCAQKSPPFEDTSRSATTVTSSLPRPTPIVSEEELAQDNKDSFYAKIQRQRNATNRRRVLADYSVLHNLVLLIRFSDHKDDNLPSPENYDVLFNNDGPESSICPTGSVNDLFESNFYGEITIKHTVVGWVDINMTELEAAGDPSIPCNGICTSAGFRDGISEALEYVETTLGLDFSDFDLDEDGKVDIFTVIHSGHGAEVTCSASDERVWSHKWRLSPSYYSSNDIKVTNYAASPGRWGAWSNSISRIGVIAHEITHFLGMPDLYDTTEKTKGIGHYGLMSDAWGSDNSQRYPPSMCPWIKEQLGIVEPFKITESGVYSIPAVQDGGEGSIYRIDFIDGTSGDATKDYLLIENRQNKGFDSLLPGGILIWHIDSKMSSNSFTSYPGESNWPSLHYMVALVQADGNYDLEKDNNDGDDGDWWFAGRSELSDFSSPTLNSYYFIEDNLCSGHVLSNFSISGDIMTFEYTKTTPNCETAGPTLSPSTAAVVSTDEPTVTSSLLEASPTPYPTRNPTPYPTQNFGRTEDDSITEESTSVSEEDGSSARSGLSNLTIILLGAAGGAAVVAFAVLGSVFYRRRHRLARSNQQQQLGYFEHGSTNNFGGSIEIGVVIAPNAATQKEAPSYMPLAPSK